ncbi:MAG: 6-phosphogluconolactonase [Aestuariivirga sp.]
MIAERHMFEDGASLAAGLAKKVADLLRETVADKGHAILAVSGGTTPQPFFQALSAIDLNWGKVQVTLVDERQVPEDSPRSNAKLVKESLLQDKAAAAHFVPLYQNLAASDLGNFDIAILGMGNDGHTASFFPGGDELESALDPDGKTAILEMSAPAAGEPRLTFTLPKLLAAQHLFLHIQGAEKMAVLDQALSGSNILEMPIRAVLYAKTPVELYWCP